MRSLPKFGALRPYLRLLFGLAMFGMGLQQWTRNAQRAPLTAGASATGNQRYGHVHATAGLAESQSSQWLKTPRSSATPKKEKAQPAVSIPSIYHVQAPDPARLKAYDVDRGQGRRVVHIDIEGEINLSTERLVLKRLEALQAEDIVVFVFDTPGGRLDAAEKISAAIRRLDNPSVAFIPDRSYSAGTFLALSCDVIAMSPLAFIGDVQPIFFSEQGIEEAPEKVKTVLRTQMRTFASEKGRNPDIAEAMVEKDKELDGWIDKGELITLNAHEAYAVGYADLLADDENALLTALNLHEAERIDTEHNWAESLSRFLTSSAVAALMTSFGFLLLMFELYSPGFGIFGILGIVMLLLTYLGHYTADLATSAEAILILIGLGLLAVEVFIIPGFGLAGLTGLACIMLGLALMRVPTTEQNFEYEGVQDAISGLGDLFISAGGFVATVLCIILVGGIALVQWIPQTPLGNWLVFKDATRSPETAPAPPSGDLDIDYSTLLHQIGVATSVLRPSGTARFDTVARVAVQSEGQFIDAGASIKVTSVQGATIIVQPAVSEETSPA